MDTEITGPAPSVHGRPVFWAQDQTQSYLAWQYARDGWAVLDSSVRDYPSLGGMPPWHDLCAPDADGLSVVIAINGKAAPDPVDVFAHDTRLLGPDPANWTTRPLG